MIFDKFVAIDWSGAKGKNHKGICLAINEFSSRTIQLVKSKKKNWSREDIIKTYSDIIETWKPQNISNKIGYDRNSFDVSSIQENIDLVKTRLTNFDLDGNFLLEWDCSYIVRKEDHRWLISVGTTNNKTSTSMK